MNIVSLVHHVCKLIFNTDKDFPSFKLRSYTLRVNMFTIHVHVAYYIQ